VVALSGQVFPPCFLHSSAVTQQILRSTSSANSALTSANSANQVANNAMADLTGVIQDLVSPSYPCGCH
jgi:hypothetical protein